MKDWNDFLPNDDEEQDDDMFGTNRTPNQDWIERQVEIEKTMLFADIQKGNPIPLSPKDWSELWEITQGDKDELTQLWVRHYMRIGDTTKGRGELLDMFPRKWLTLLLIHNEEKEEYELCSLINELILWEREKGKEVVS